MVYRFLDKSQQVNRSGNQNTNFEPNFNMLPVDAHVVSCGMGSEETDVKTIHMGSNDTRNRGTSSVGSLDVVGYPVMFASVTL